MVCGAASRVTSPRSSTTVTGNDAAVAVVAVPASEDWLVPGADVDVGPVVVVVAGTASSALSPSSSPHPARSAAATATTAIAIVARRPRLPAVRAASPRSPMRTAPSSRA